MSFLSAWSSQPVVHTVNFSFGRPQDENLTASVTSASSNERFVEVFQSKGSPKASMMPKEGDVSHFFSGTRISRLTAVGNLGNAAIVIPRTTGLLSFAFPYKTTSCQEFSFSNYNDLQQLDTVGTKVEMVVIDPSRNVSINLQLTSSDSQKSMTQYSILPGRLRVAQNIRLFLDQNGTFEEMNVDVQYEDA